MSQVWALAIALEIKALVADEEDEDEDEGGREAEAGTEAASQNRRGSMTTKSTPISPPAARAAQRSGDGGTTRAPADWAISAQISVSESTAMVLPLRTASTADWESLGYT